MFFARAIRLDRILSSSYELIILEMVRLSTTVTRATLCETAQSVGGVARSDAAGICERMIELIGAALAEGETVKLTGFGTLEVRSRAERIGRNPRTGEEHTISTRRVVMLVPSASLRGKLGKS